MTQLQRTALAQRLKENHPLLARLVEEGKPLIPEDAKFLREILLKAPNSWFNCDRYEILREFCNHSNSTVDRSGSITGLVGVVRCQDCGYEREWNAY
jgi:hypothetical protein